jgi:hypothetical protein
MQAHANPRAVFHRLGSQRRLACRRVVHAEWNLKVVLALIAQQNRRWRAGAWIRRETLRALPDRMESFDR